METHDFYFNTSSSLGGGRGATGCNNSSNRTYNNCSTSNSMVTTELFTFEIVINFNDFRGFNSF